jgi:hypothetical protein
VPEGGGFDVAAWLVPGLLSLIALLGVGVAALSWRRRRDDGPVAEGPELDPEDRRRLEADMAAHDR